MDVHLGILRLILPAMKSLEINPECDQILYKSATQPTYLGYKRVVILTYVQLPLY